ncbi:MAG: stage II sporulation protein R [Clostridia bacterium]|nr:stage II sporulation protein R [Clostridia bacterium]
MKKFGISFLVLLIIVVSAIGISSTQKTENVEYLRIHVRADSNDESAQAVKYKVKDAVVDFLTPYIASITTKAQAEQKLNELLPQIESVADSVLRENGFSYSCKAKLDQENFPTRTYDDLTLEQGYYDALILELGSGKGDNWWCVVYPPLCFTGDSDVQYIYKSKILEIINDFKSNR